MSGSFLSYSYLYSLLIQFFADQPTAMDSLQLVPSDEDLILEWDRPDNVPSEVVIYYTVIIDSTNETMTNYNENFTTTERFFSLQFLQDRIMNDSAGGDCITFELSVFGSNDAGSGPLTTIMDTIPICKMDLKGCMHKGASPN